MRIYISGPIDGIENKNKKNFDSAVHFLTGLGHRAFNPLRTDWKVKSKKWLDYLIKDLELISGLDGMYMLDGWENSFGCRIEHLVAKKLNQVIMYQTTSVAVAGDKLVHGKRQRTYGHPYQDFTRTAHMWEAILGCSVTAEQVGLCMIALKLSRQVHKSKRDNLVDIAGYAETVNLINSEARKVWQ